VWLSDEALGGRGAVWPLDRNLVQGGQDLLLARAESMMPMLIEREEAVAPLHTRAAAL
jgi:hypothetical protein